MPIRMAEFKKKKQRKSNADKVTKKEKSILFVHGNENWAVI